MTSMDEYTTFCKYNMYIRYRFRKPSVMLQVYENMFTQISTLFSYSFYLQRVLLRVASFLCIRKEPKLLADNANNYENGVYNECVTENLQQDNASQSRQPRDMAVKIEALSSAQTWTIIASILDRIFFLIYLLVILVLSTVFMLPK